MLDLVLAIFHHLLAFSLFGTLAAELSIVRPSISAREVRLLANIDRWYGAIAGAIVIVGFSRVIFATKGWDYYAHNSFFWAKMGAFVAVGLLSIAPTMRILGWRRSQRGSDTAMPSAGDVSFVRRFLWAELVFFALIPIFAAAMARGYGS